MGKKAVILKSPTAEEMRGREKHRKEKGLGEEKMKEKTFYFNICLLPIYINLVLSGLYLKDKAYYLFF